MAAVLLWVAGGAEAEAPGAREMMISGDALLKGAEAPAGAGVAKNAPRVWVYLFADLPQDSPKALWSSWGDGCVASDGTYYTGIGNHLDYDAGRGESGVYAVDPVNRRVKLVVNVRAVVPDERYAAGKIHAKIDQGKDGAIYFATYYGKTPEKGSEKTRESFIGSALLRFDPGSGKTEMLGAPVPRQGVPTSIMDAGRMLLYGYAAYSGDFVVYDLAKRELKYRGGGDQQEGSRNIILDREGRAYFGRSDGVLARYDPQTSQVSVTKARLPDGSLRASTRAGADGVVYGVTQAGTLFAFDPAKEEVREMGENWPGGQYTAVMELSPDGRYVYYAPGAHGSGAKLGTPVVQFDVKTRQRKVIAFLNPVCRERLGYNMGGTYNLKLSADGGRLLCTFNGAKVDASARREQTFGWPSIVVIEIPREER
jgi:sugar lactone lactonase YvrE